MIPVFVGPSGVGKVWHRHLGCARGQVPGRRHWQGAFEDTCCFSLHLRLYFGKRVLSCTNGTLGQFAPWKGKQSLVNSNVFALSEADSPKRASSERDIFGSAWLA
jgi:hypothetical protein